jgi:hypothetical protein
MNEVKEDVIKFVKNYYNEDGKVPSVARICKNVPHLYNSKFYAEFPGGMVEVCKAAKIPIPKERIKRTRRASEKKKRIEKDENKVFIEISSQKYDNLNSIAYLENKSVEEVIDVLINNHRYLFQKYDLSADDIGYINLAFNEFKDQDKVKVIKLMLQIIKQIGFRKISYRFLNMLINLTENAIRNNWSINTINVLYNSKVNMYNRGIQVCINRMGEIVCKALSKIEHRHNLNMMEKLKVALDIKDELSSSFI